MKGVSDVYDKTNLCRLGSGLHFPLPDPSLWTVGLDAFLEKSSKFVDLFSHSIDKEADIDVLQFSCTSYIGIPLDETSPV